MVEDKKTGIFRKSVKNNLFWSFVYVLIFVWAVIVINQALLGELIDYMLLKNDLKTIHDETRTISWQINALLAAGMLPEHLQKDEDIREIKSDGLERLSIRKINLDGLVAEYAEGRLPYRFLILKKRSEMVAGEIYELNSEWESITDIIGTFLANRGAISDADYEILSSAFESMRSMLTVVDESNPGRRPSLVSASRKIISYYYIGFIVFVILLIIVFIYLYKSFISPLEKLNMAFDEVKLGDLESRLEMKGNDEFTTLGSNFNAMVSELDRSQKEFIHMNRRLKTLFAEREAELNEKRLSLEMAREVQEAIIPMAFNLRNINVATGFIPYEELSGDFFDIFPLGGNKLALLFGDIMGKGIPASLKMMSFHSLFRATINENDSVTHAARTINKLEISEVSRGQEAYQLTTAILGRIDIQNLDLHLVNCGHPPPLMWRESQADVFELPVINPIIGFDQDAEFEEMVIDLQEGDLIFFYTDGLIEQRNTEGEEYDVERAKRALAKYHDLRPDELITAFKTELADFSSREGDDEPFKDDILFCVLRVDKYPWFKLDFPGKQMGEIAESLVDYMRVEELSNDTISDINLVFQELFANAYQHGSKENPTKTIEVGICINKGELILYVQDEGDGFDQSTVDFLLDPEKMYGERGRGLYLVKGVVDEIEFNQQGNRVTIRKKIAAKEGHCNAT